MCLCKKSSLLFVFDFIINSLHINYICWTFQNSVQNYKMNKVIIFQISRRQSITSFLVEADYFSWEHGRFYFLIGFVGFVIAQNFIILDSSTRTFRNYVICQTANASNLHYEILCLSLLLSFYQPRLFCWELWHTHPISSRITACRLDLIFVYILGLYYWNGLRNVAIQIYTKKI